MGPMEHAPDAPSVAPSGVHARFCCSDDHTVPTPAEVVGTFDCAWMNGRPPEDDRAYCLRCAALLAEAKMFTPTDGTVLPSIEELLARSDGKRSQPS